MRVIALSEFRPAAPPQPLASDEIHLWFFPQWNGPPRGAAESSCVRELLGAYLGRAAHTLTFARSAHGKPGLIDAGVEFNLSHSGGALLVGLSREQALGVDLEMPRRPRPVLELAQRYFDPAEASALARVSPAQQQAAFLRLWACKEAVLKAHGGGISLGLDLVPFDIGPDGEVLDAHPFKAPLDDPAWRIVVLRVDEEAAGAIAWRGSDRHIRAYRAHAG